MKHHQPQLCERVSTLHRSGCGAKKSLQKDFSPSSTTSHKPEREPKQADQSLGSLSDLLLALQDELGQMSLWVCFFFSLLFCFAFTYSVICVCFFFVSEHQELVSQIDATQHHKQRQDLQKELERLVDRMEEKGAQITKLRKHQQAVCEPSLCTIQRHVCKDGQLHNFLPN